MEELKNGVISEEALDEIAGGLSLSSISLKNALIAAGVSVVAAGAFTAGAFVQDMSGVDVAGTLRNSATEAATKVGEFASNTSKKWFGKTEADAKKAKLDKTAH